MKPAMPAVATTSSDDELSGALPGDFPEPYLEVTFGFYYLLPGDEERFFNRERSTP